MILFAALVVLASGVVRTEDEGAEARLWPQAEAFQAPLRSARARGQVRSAPARGPDLRMQAPEQDDAKRQKVERALRAAKGGNIPGGWESKVDATTGDRFFWNKENKEVTSWDPPKEMIKEMVAILEEQAPTTDGAGNFYDEDNPLPKKEISDAMRKRLLNEQRAIGADSGSKNPFLLVFGAVGVFVVLGYFATR